MSLRRIFNLSCTATSKTDKSRYSNCLFIFPSLERIRAKGNRKRQIHES